MALPNKTKIPVGTVLAGKYRITRELGRGGMAAVYQAENVDIGKHVAIKVLAQELTTSAIVVERFLREARASAAIRSPYICDVYDSGKLEDGRPFLVLELLEGESLYERMTKVRWFDPDTTCAIVTQVCRGLTKAHAASIVHRDLKPENIFLTRDEEGKLLAKLLDFGLAKFYAPLEAGTKAQARLTREGAVFGTPAYMSPEQVRGQGAVDHRADLWAIGCIVYECFTGRTVWATDQGVAMTFAQIANSPLPKPDQHRPDLPPQFTAWFEKALHRDINQRFQTAKELSDSLAVAFSIGRPSSAAAYTAQPATALPEPREQQVEPPPRRPPVPPPRPPSKPASPLQGNPFFQPSTGGPLAFAEPALPPTPTEHRVAPEAATGGAPSSISSRGPATADPIVAGPQPLEPANGPLSPRASKLGFVAPETGVGTPSARRRGLGLPARAALLAGGVALVVAAVYAGWLQLSGETTKPAPAASSSADTAPALSAASSATTSARREPLPAGPSLPWIPLVRSGQEALARGDLKGAAKLFKDALDRGGHGVPRTMWEHVLAAQPGADRSPCKLTGLGRPRAFDLVAGSPKSGNAGRPSIVHGPHGAVVAWTDSHEGPEHAYTVALDDVLRNAGNPVDVTPEGTQVSRPEIARAGDKLVLTYSDVRGPEAGIHVRFLDADGHIAGPAVSVAPVHGHTTPTSARAADGSFFVAWTDTDGSDSEDLFLRRVSPALEPLGAVARATDFVPAGPSKPRVRLPSLAVEGGALLVAFRFERDPQRAIQSMRLPLADAARSLEPLKKAPGRADRTTGELSLVNTDKGKGDAPQLACGSGTCFLVWHGEANTGASAAMLDPGKSQPIWRRRFTRTGGHPAVAVAPGGQAQVVWFEPKSVLIASINRDNLGPSSKIARISGEQPAPSISAGAKPGEWYLAWLDYESGHLEPYVARVACK